jgi:hypothetical protein
MARYVLTLGFPINHSRANQIWLADPFNISLKNQIRILESKLFLFLHLFFALHRWRSPTMPYISTWAKTQWNPVCSMFSNIQKSNDKKAEIYFSSMKKNQWNCRLLR